MPPPRGVGEVIGLTYTVELVSGTSFIGRLTAVSAEELTFETTDLGLLTVKRPNIKQITLLTQEQARLGYDYLGNGNRLSFAPTARNLRRGEGTVQNIYIFLLGVNYGITDNFSMGALFTWVPEAGSENFFALTPKVSFPVSGDKVHVGAGALIAFQGGNTFTLAYGNTTYGSADNNVTAGVGYAFVRGEYFNTPVFLLGGATRVSRRISLVNETYILTVKDQFDRATFVGGIAGLRMSGQRLSGSLGLMYGLYSYSNSRYGSNEDSDGGAIPFAEVTYRFGRTK
ncbi:hypothetical protein [Hymenobacter arizonensis]|nr:hypothetical protein [Hymenobacter arizonensis]